MIDLFKIILLILLFGGIIVASFVGYMIWMPSADVEINENELEHEFTELENRLRAHVVRLSESSVGRNFIDEDYLTPAKNYISDQFRGFGYKPSFQSYNVYGDKYSNIVIDVAAKDIKAPVLIVGAHYDSVEGCPGANDNASGVAALIEIGRYFSKVSLSDYRLRLVAFANEEPYFFQTDEMGSLVYARSLPDTEEIFGMISLETIGYYTNEKGSQRYPKLFDKMYPDTGNFISFIGNLQSRKLVSSSISLFRQHSAVPSEGVAAPAIVPGVAWSDHWSFWMQGHNAIMVTDTAPYRYEHYHKNTDTPDKLNYPQYAKVVYGLIKMVEGLVDRNTR